ncbi:putative Phage protein [Azospirillaceae bacterium]
MAKLFCGFRGTVSGGRDVTLGGKDFFVEYEAGPDDFENSGIGPYEYWGARCFDSGHDYVASFKITDVSEYVEGDSGTLNFLPDKDAEPVRKLIYDDDNLVESILTELTEAAETNAGDMRRGEDH